MTQDAGVQPHLIGLDLSRHRDAGGSTSAPAPWVSGRATTGRLPRTGLGSAAVLAVALVLAGCDAGTDAETTREVPDTPGVDGSVGEVVLDDVFLDADAAVEAGASVPLRGALTNDAEQADRLVSVTTPAAESVQLLAEDGAVSAAGIDLPGGEQVDATTGAVRMQLQGVTAPIEITDTVRVTFVFDTAGEVTLDVPVGTTT